MITFWANASPATKKSVYIMTSIFILILIIVPTVWHQNTTTAQNRMNTVVSDDNITNAQKMIIDIKLSIVNTDDYTYTLIMALTPYGNLSLQRDNITRYSAPITLYVKGQSFQFPRYSPAGVIEFKTKFQSGTSNSYPLDIYGDVFDLSVLTIRDDGSYGAIGIRTDYTGAFDSYDVSAHVKSYEFKSTFKLDISRTGTTKFFSLSVILLMWLLSFTILTLSITIWVRKRTVEPPTIAVAAGLLFAIPQLRNVQPGIPSIGCAADTLSFFWCMALIAFSLLLLMWNYIINKREKLSPNDSAAFLKMQKDPSGGSYY